MTTVAHFTSKEVCFITRVTPPVVRNLVRGKVLRKRPQGTGIPLRYSLDDVLRIAVAKTLTTTGIDVSAIKEMFEAIDLPSVPGARPWKWLRTRERVEQGAYLLLVTESPKLPANTGSVSLLPKDDAFTTAARLRGKIVLIDVGAEIAQIEARSGEAFLDAEPETTATTSTKQSA